jgi:hypothetical protein
MRQFTLRAEPKLMRRVVCGLVVSLTFALPVPAAEPVSETVTITLQQPAFPSPMQTSILGLSITAIAVVGARVSNRNSDTMMYMVLASVAVTALMVVFSDRQYKAYYARVSALAEQLKRDGALPLPVKPG